MNLSNKLILGKTLRIFQQILCKINELKQLILIIKQRLSKCKDNKKKKKSKKNNRDFYRDSMKRK